MRENMYTPQRVWVLTCYCEYCDINSKNSNRMGRLIRVFKTRKDARIFKNTRRLTKKFGKIEKAYACYQMGRS